MRRPSFLEILLLAAVATILIGVAFILWFVGEVIDVSLAAAGIK